LFGPLLKVVEQVAANIPAPGVPSNPSCKLRDLSKIRGTNPLPEGVRHPLHIFGRPNLALVGRRVDKLRMVEPEKQILSPGPKTNNQSQNEEERLQPSAQAARLRIACINLHFSMTVYFAPPLIS
jgi:hypothetical protein